MRFLIELAIVIYMAMPAAAWAQAAVIKDPLAYPVRQYGLVLAFAILGGLVSWYRKVKRGELPGNSLFHLVGEITTSAFVGLLVFYGCEYLDVPQILTAPIVGVAGHLGARALGWIESWLKAHAERKAGVPLE